MKIVGIIPARKNSTRLPNKVLLDINGKPMIQHVYENLIKAKLESVIVACDDEDVFRTVLSFGGKAIITAKDHINGTSRIAEVARNIDADYIINVQGDEPLIKACMINDLISAIDQNVKVITLKQKLDNDIDNPNIVKVITDYNDNAIYFSRSRIPFNRNNDVQYYKHIGVYCYDREFLFDYINMIPTKLEEAESLEQLRIIENGYVIKVIESDYSSIGVDTLQDLKIVRGLLKSDKL